MKRSAFLRMRRIAGIPSMSTRKVIRPFFLLFFSSFGTPENNRHRPPRPRTLPAPLRSKNLVARRTPSPNKPSAIAQTSPLARSLMYCEGVNLRISTDGSFSRREGGVPPCSRSPRHRGFFRFEPEKGEPPPERLPACGVVSSEATNPQSASLLAIARSWSRMIKREAVHRRPLAPNNHARAQLRLRL